MRQMYGNRRQERINNNFPFILAVFIYFCISKYSRNIWKGGSGNVDQGPCWWFGCSDRIGTDEIDFVHI